MKISFDWTCDHINNSDSSQRCFNNYTAHIWKCLNFMFNGFENLKPVDYKATEIDDPDLRKESGTIIMRADDMPHFRRFTSLEDLKHIIMTDDQVTGYESLCVAEGVHEVSIETRGMELCNPSFAIRIKGLGFHDNLDNVTTVVFDDVE